MKRPTLRSSLQPLGLGILAQHPIIAVLKAEPAGSDTLNSNRFQTTLNDRIRSGKTKAESCRPSPESKDGSVTTSKRNNKQPEPMRKWNNPNDKKAACTAVERVARPEWQ